MKFFLLLGLSVSLAVSAVVVPDDYAVEEDETLSYVYGKEYNPLLSEIKSYQKGVMSQYEKEFGFPLDDELRVGLATSNNQIANGFSTQIPLNQQVFYASGAAYIDYFCFSSWLKTLLIHETAHNYQLNPKENFLSKTGHKIFGNAPVTFLGLFPIFPVPNVTESSFILEGNAVLNESRFGNGGRLFSGYALAEVVALAKAGEITPQLMYNSTLEFPYGEKFYLVGGFFQQFLAKKYGIKKVNGYFKRYAAQPFPFFTNIIFKKEYGKSFETLLAEFVQSIKEEHKEAKSLKGKELATSQLFVPLNRQGDEILTLVGDRKSVNELFSLNVKTKAVKKISDDWREGEVFKVKGKYLTQSSANTSPVKVEMGLFDDDGFLEKGFGSKAVQGFLANGKAVYFDVKSSLEAPQVYVDGAFYTTSHSSVHVDKNDLYYFKQEGEKRTLFKNKTPLFSFEGHYGFVVDVDEKGAIYFVGSSKHGSTVYKFENGTTTRVLEADNVIDLKLLNQNEAMVATIESDRYGYYLTSLFQSTQKQKPFSPNVEAEALNLFYNKPFGEGDKAPKKAVKDYNSLTALEYSSWSPFLSYTAELGYGVDAVASFSDPLFQNQLALVVSYNKERSIGGVVYDNSAFRLLFGGAVYGVAKNENYNNSDKRDSGYEMYATYPWFEQGYWNISNTLAYTKPYHNIYREPLTLSLDVSNQKQYGFSKYANSSNSLTLFASDDRDNNMVGGSYSFKHDLGWQSYLGLKGTYLKSDNVNFLEEKGIELDNTFSNLQSDLGTIDVPSFTFRTYAQEVKMGELSLAKVFDGSLYFYSFPLSLQREAFYAKQRRYEIDFTSTLQRSYDETTVGTTFDLLFFHKVVVPLSIEWVHNKDVLDQDKARLLIGGSF